MSDLKKLVYEIAEVTASGSVKADAEYTWVDSGHMILGNVGCCLNCGLPDDEELPVECPGGISDERRGQIEEALLVSIESPPDHTTG